ncbi:hypothetical protein [Pectinatus sottacetonis]|uniref:hypothetical protein n=1 Tax=Pectinatus sottacetonis TaxID=1002795 RepID=UPI0018C5754D|nr:hypothetical protein [Pectinatus sottacetonis]
MPKGKNDFVMYEKIENELEYYKKYDVLTVVCHKAPCFSNGDISHVHRICVSN